MVGVQPRTVPVPACLAVPGVGADDEDVLSLRVQGDGARAQHPGDVYLVDVVVEVQVHQVGAHDGDQHHAGETASRPRQNLPFPAPWCPRPSAGAHPPGAHPPEQPSARRSSARPGFATPAFAHPGSAGHWSVHRGSAGSGLLLPGRVWPPLARSGATRVSGIHRFSSCTHLRGTLARPARRTGRDVTGGTTVTRAKWSPRFQAAGPLVPWNPCRDVTTAHLPRTARGITGKSP
jgi:hypothetical protein